MSTKNKGKAPRISEEGDNPSEVATPPETLETLYCRNVFFKLSTINYIRHALENRYADEEQLCNLSSGEISTKNTDGFSQCEDEGYTVLFNLNEIDFVFVFGISYDKNENEDEDEKIFLHYGLDDKTIVPGKIAFDSEESFNALLIFTIISTVERKLMQTKILECTQGRPSQTTILH